VCVVVAASREQAGILFNQAAGFVRRSERLRARVKLTLRELRSRGDAGRLRVLAADAETADGAICTLAIVDELARHKSTELLRRTGSSRLERFCGQMKRAAKVALPDGPPEPRHG